MGKKDKKKPRTLTEALRAPRGPIDVKGLDAQATPLFPGKDKDDAVGLIEDLEPALDEMQERLFATARAGDPHAQRVLVVLQGMDTSGKGGVIRHVIGQVDPQGVHIHSFKAPTAEERKHDFLWRVRRELPAPGEIGIFDRSHYEDVLVQRVERMATPAELESRYGRINEFEAEVASSGTRIIKCFLNISRAEQKDRLLERIERPDKYWKYNAGDVAARTKWDEYMSAYSLALERCNEDYAPWFIVPADNKWYRNWAIARLLLETLVGMDLTWPPAQFDAVAERARIEAS